MNNQQQTPEQMFQQLSVEAMVKTVFPPECVHPDFKHWVGLALFNNSMAAMRIQLGSYEKLLNMTEPLIMPEMMLALHMLHSSTPYELGVTPPEYYIMLRDVHTPMLQKLMEMEREIQEPIMSKVEAKMKLAKAIPQSKKFINLGQA